MIPSAWPETIVFGHIGASLEKGRKTGLPPSQIAKGFWPPPRRAKTPFRVGLYARVSIRDQQTIPVQTRAMREYADRRTRRDTTWDAPGPRCSHSPRQTDPPVDALKIDGSFVAGMRAQG